MIDFPLISVIVPTYNQEKYIRECLESIARQDYPNFEIIVVDDGSTDHTSFTVEKTFSSFKVPTKFFRQPNQGAHAAINQGVKLSNGEYIAILNSDDLFYPTRLSKMYSALANNQQRFAFSKVRHIDDYGNTHQFQDQYLRTLENASQFPTINFEFLRTNIAVSTGNFLFHRSLYEEIGPFRSFVTCHDWDYVLRVLIIEEPLFVDEILLDYRIHSEGTLQKNLDKVNEEVEQIMLTYFDHLPEATNKQAPGPKQWGVYWNYFSTNFLDRIRKSPQVDEKIRRIEKETESVYETEESRGIKEEFLNYIGAPKPIELDLVNVPLETPKVDLTHPKGQFRMLIILPWMVMGGAERFILNIMDQLSQTGWSFTIITTAPAENVWKSKFLTRTSDIYELPDFLPINEYPRFLKFLIELRQIDLIFLQGTLEGYRLLPYLRILFPNIPIVDYLHFVIPEWMDGGYPRLSLTYRDCLDMTIASCEQVRKWMIEQGDNEERIKVCTINPDHNFWHPDEARKRQVRKLFNIGVDKTVILYAARLEHQKQPDVMIETLKKLSEKGHDFSAFIAGDGSLFHQLKSIVKESNLEQKIYLFGAVDPDKMRDLYISSDVFFLPSQNEGIALTIYEAMACGLPIVGADVGGQAELVTTECGFLLPPQSKEDLVSSYAEILSTLIQSPSLRQEMGVASRQRILSSFSIHKMKSCINEALQEVLQQKMNTRGERAILSRNELAKREARYVVEFLYAMSEIQRTQKMYHDLTDSYQKLSSSYQELSEKYFELLQPKPARYWFYLWIRQLLLPLYGRWKRGKTYFVLSHIKEWIKSKAVGEK
ncbi:MAG: Beta-1,3-glucosyltransferase [Anaerolineae bacterium]|jgi:glycosyltransferase involved in cell wall biosynthesis|nr:MAG: Beta-1,3-glucosyltransferase [Anaerolineae bacterium]